jgi:hypothetical protein
MHQDLKNQRVGFTNNFYATTRKGHNVDDVRGSVPFATSGIIFLRLDPSLYGRCEGGASSRMFCLVRQSILSRCIGEATSSVLFMRQIR